MGDAMYYVDGVYVPKNRAMLPLGDLGIVRGYGVFDFLRTYTRIPFMLREHVERLMHSAQQIGLETPWTMEEIESIVNETNSRNGFENASIRIVVTGGQSSDYLTPEGDSTLSVMVDALKPYRDEFYADGVTITTTDIPRIMPTVKSLNYIGAIMAMQEAKRVGAIEAVYRTEVGLVTEGTRSNLFIIKDGQLVTPKDGILPGITRMATLRAIQGHYTVIERDVTYDELLQADEVFMTSTTKEVLPVSKVDDTIIGGGRAGELTLDVAERLSEYVRAYISARADA